MFSPAPSRFRTWQSRAVERPWAEAGPAPTEAKRRLADLSGQPPWGAQADAAVATVALARGDRARALELAQAALTFRQRALREEPHLEILLPAARAVLAI